ncbi:hypothetical protein H2O64_03620 [Kordia sp. YSTF-M3]|uniref:Threonine synthase n=1 Tax=Kordia aestuariivivens TaxID=2759037 RepID=A0ABR7Q5K2_9FLAO|nr:DUF6503 family protein [Kordia aestuariivivens]MBC8753743.1 hypothetical protein [Kordia aestuariivivens]
MKKGILAILGMFLIIACKDDQKKAKTPETTTKEEVKVATKTYPENLQKVFDAHGGIDTWNEAQTLVYEMVKPEATEKHITDLHSRKTRLEGKNFTIGYDGKDVWLAQKDTTAFKSNARFYHNLYFYFYAMPFVLGDDGIIYSEVESLSYEGVSYPGYKISYGDNVGDSPEDNYFIYYNPETFQMEWLGYTVTYFNGKPSTRVSYIRYSDWQNVNGVLLPKTLTWHKSEDNKVLEVRNSVEFTNVSLNKKTMDNKMYEKPADGVVVPKG